MEVPMKCPFCLERKGTDDQGQHLYYNTDKDLFHCFRCGASGKGEPEGLVERIFSRPEPTPEKLGWCESLTDLFRRGGILARKAWHYLSSHNCDPEKVAYEYKLLFREHHLVFPVYSNGTVVYWQARDLLAKRFCNPTGHPRPLFWTHTLSPTVGGFKPVGQNGVAIVESALNAIRLEWFLPAVATFGKLVSDEQLMAIKARTTDVIVCLDAGEQAESLALARKLKAWGFDRIVLMWLKGPDGLDVCDMKDCDLWPLLQAGGRHRRVNGKLEMVDYWRRAAR